MKRLLVFTLVLCAVAPLWAQTNVGVSIGIDRPGVYGRIEIGNAAPPPAVIYAQPVIYTPTRVAVYQRPIYLHVPPGHEKHWGQHCARYNACGQPVYFVQERWIHEHAHGDRYRDDDHRQHGKKDKKFKAGHGHH